MLPTEMNNPQDDMVIWNWKFGLWIVLFYHVGFYFACVFKMKPAHKNFASFTEMESSPFRCDLMYKTLPVASLVIKDNEFKALLSLLHIWRQPKCSRYAVPYSGCYSDLHIITCFKLFDISS